MEGWGFIPAEEQIKCGQRSKLLFLNTQHQSQLESFAFSRPLMGENATLMINLFSTLL